MKNKYTMSLYDRRDEVNESMQNITEARILIAKQDLEQDFLKDIRSNIIPVLNDALSKARAHRELLNQSITALENQEDQLRLDADKQVEISIEKLTQKLNNTNI